MLLPVFRITLADVLFSPARPHFPCSIALVLVIHPRGRKKQTKLWTAVLFHLLVLPLKNHSTRVRNITKKNETSLVLYLSQIACQARPRRASPSS